MRKTTDGMIRMGANIKKARQRDGLTQEDFAESIDVKPQYLSDLEHGLVGISFLTLVKICERLNVTVNYLVFGNEDNDEYE